MSTTIEPEQGTVLVQLSASQYGDIPVPKKSYASLTRGIIIAVNPLDKDKAYLVDRMGYWREFKDDCRIVGTSFALVEIKDILGSSYDIDSKS